MITLSIKLIKVGMWMQMNPNKISIQANKLQNDKKDKNKKNNFKEISSISKTLALLLVKQKAC